MIKNFLITSFLVSGSISAFAQLSGSVNVEGEYEPLVIETERLNFPPVSYRFDLPPVNLSYIDEGIVTDFRPGLLTMGVSGRQTSWPYIKRKGYVDARLGSYLRSRLDAGYYIITDSVNTLLATLDFESSSLFRPSGTPFGYTQLPLKRLYEGAFGLSYDRLIGQEGLLKASVGYRGAYFNYYGTSVPEINLFHPLHIPTQTLNRVRGSVSFSSSPSTIRGWHAEADVNYFGYRRFYPPVVMESSFSGDRETELKVGGGYAFGIYSSSAITVDVAGDFLFYAKNHPEALAITNYHRKNYGIVSLKPAYRFSNETLSVKAGLDMDFSWDAMGKSEDTKFGLFHAAPDISLTYKSDIGLGVELAATGGVSPSTLALREQFDRYQMPWLLSTQPVYSPVDGRLGINIGPFAGFAGSATLRYAVAKNVPLGGWYQVFLGSALNEKMSFPAVTYTDPYAQSLDLRGLSVGLDLRYAFGSMAEVEFKGSYTPQTGSSGIFNGFDRPRWILSAKVSVKPVKNLKIEAGYDYRGIRNCYYLETTDEDTLLKSYRLSDITNLNARVNYSILKNLDIYCQSDNLLNRKVDLLPGLQSEGIVISGGVYFEF